MNSYRARADLNLGLLVHKSHVLITGLCQLPSKNGVIIQHNCTNTVLFYVTNVLPWPWVNVLSRKCFHHSLHEQIHFKTIELPFQSNPSEILFTILHIYYICCTCQQPETLQPTHGMAYWQIISSYKHTISFFTNSIK